MRRLLTSMIIAIAAAGLVGCGSTATWHRKLTVTVSTPSGDIHGFSVQREEIKDKSGWWVPPEASGAGRAVGGEAVVVEVKPGRYLFALLDGIKPDTFQVMLPGEAPLEVAKKLATMRGQKVVPSSLYPKLVTFTDVNSPASVKEVKPDNLADAFGPGYSLKSVMLEITDEPVTKGRAEKLLPWLKDLVGLNLDGSNTSNNPGGLAANIGDSNFRTGK
jgi:hypothetical protein